jgi:hypothetical protein
VFSLFVSGEYKTVTFTSAVVIVAISMVTYRSVVKACMTHFFDVIVGISFARGPFLCILCLIYVE